MTGTASFEKNFRQEDGENMKDNSVLAQIPVLRWLLQPARIPLLFGVTIVSGIFYHYAPEFTVFWIVLSLLLQAPLFRLFDFTKKHSLIGGVIFCTAGALYLIAALTMIKLGYNTPLLAPTEHKLQLNFMVWFLTPQSVLTVRYLGYTIALFLLFTFFIATVAYYFTMVRYRVLMSFVVMIFPFAIYAKENETMPVPSIIILLVCYFAVMIYCRQAHAESADVVQAYAPEAESTLSMPPKKSPFAGVLPEMLDGRFFNAAGIFLAAAIILVLMIPKPHVDANRVYLDSMLDQSSLSDYLMNAISGFTDSSDSSVPTAGVRYSHTLYYAKADEPLNLRVRTFSNYDYEEDKWFAEESDGKPAEDDADYRLRDGFRTVMDAPDAGMIFETVVWAAKQNPDFAAKWNLQALAQSTLDPADYYAGLFVESATYNYFVYPAPMQVAQVDYSSRGAQETLQQNRSGIMFRYREGRAYKEVYRMQYLSPAFAAVPDVQTLTSRFNTAEWEQFLTELHSLTETDSSLRAETISRALQSCQQANAYAARIQSQTPDDVKALAASLTEGLHSDYEKAAALRDYLRYSGEFLYSLDFPITIDDSVETFLFKNKTGVCKQFAGAMTELCRAAGLTARYAEGYAMGEPDRQLIGDSDWDYVITTDHGHAFTDVFIAGYGWMMFDATAGTTVGASANSNVLRTLQYSGLILLGAALLVILLAFKIIPALLEKRFRHKYQKQPDAAAVQAAFARLRKQWNADPAVTARALCEEKRAFLQVDLSPLLEGFEQAVYADRCDPETAMRVFRTYCAAFDAWRPAVRRQRKAEKEARKAARQSGGEPAYE